MLTRDAYHDVKNSYDLNAMKNRINNLQAQIATDMGEVDRKKEEIKKIDELIAKEQKNLQSALETLNKLDPSSPYLSTMQSGVSGHQRSIKYFQGEKAT